MHAGPAFFLGQGVYHQTHNGVRFGQIVHAFDQRLVVHHSTADQQRNTAALGNFAHVSQRIIAKTRDGIGFVRFDDVDAVMRRFAQEFGVGLGRTDIHAFVDLRGIHADDFARQRLCERGGYSRFTAGGGAQQNDAGWVVDGGSHKNCISVRA